VIGEIEMVCICVGNCMDNHAATPRAQLL